MICHVFLYRWVFISFDTRLHSETLEERLWLFTLNLTTSVFGLIRTSAHYGFREKLLLFFNVFISHLLNVFKYIHLFRIFLKKYACICPFCSHKIGNVNLASLRITPLLARMPFSFFLEIAYCIKLYLISRTYNTFKKDFFPHLLKLKYSRPPKKGSFFPSLLHCNLSSFLA